MDRLAEISGNHNYRKQGHIYLTYSVLFQMIIPFSWIFAAIIMIPEFLVRNFDKNVDYCVHVWPEEWMGEAYSWIWFLVLALFPVTFMVALYSRVIYTLWFKSGKPDVYNYRQQV